MATAESVKAKIQGLINTANETTGGADTDLTAAVNTLAAGFGQGGGGSEAVELLFESTFTVAESITTMNEATTLATFNTGLNEGEGTDFYAVIICTNDTETDTSFNHVTARTQNLILTASGYGSTQANSGIGYSNEHIVYGATWGIYISDISRYASSITITAKGHTSWGYVASGDYSFKLYKLNNSYFGLEGI